MKTTEVPVLLSRVQGKISKFSKWKVWKHWVQQSKVWHWCEFLLLGFPMLDMELVPTSESILQTLNVMGLVGALMLALSVALATSVDADQLRAADERCMTSAGYIKYWNSLKDINFKGGFLPSESFAWYCSYSVMFLTAAVLSVIQTYVYAVFAFHKKLVIDEGPTRPQTVALPQTTRGSRVASPSGRAALDDEAVLGEDIEQPQDVSNNTAAANMVNTQTETDRFCAWYMWGRWLMLLIYVGLIVGIVYFLIAHRLLYIIKYEDRRLQYDPVPEASIYKRIALGTWIITLGCFGLACVLGLLANRASLSLDRQRPKSVRDADDNNVLDVFRESMLSLQQVLRRSVRSAGTPKVPHPTTSSTRRLKPIQGAKVQAGGSLNYGISPYPASYGNNTELLYNNGARQLSKGRHVGVGNTGLLEADGYPSLPGQLTLPPVTQSTS